MERAPGFRSGDDEGVTIDFPSLDSTGLGGETAGGWWGFPAAAGLGFSMVWE